MLLPTDPLCRAVKVTVPAEFDAVTGKVDPRAAAPTSSTPSAVWIFPPMTVAVSPEATGTSRRCPPRYRARMPAADAVPVMCRTADAATPATRSARGTTHSSQIGSFARYDRTIRASMDPGRNSVFAWPDDRSRIGMPAVKPVPRAWPTSSVGRGVVPPAALAFDTSA